ncbi:MAG: RNA-dependent RNA polymerase [Apple ourmia-like virus 3]|uniref:RNA-dependent RNA polymerase n=1 Tax=Apple ourmia-like virus 3 TaxID=2709320 RepID=A0ABX6JH50_9VIRU|nr:MAG: RNA-dependent RNA polymerase [Apple ourmia-like virus 3]QIC52830.1 MAG: RNA-dependent RNA polymerase [Apple ourmia-like virus 3]
MHISMYKGASLKTSSKLSSSTKKADLLSKSMRDFDGLIGKVYNQPSALSTLTSDPKRLKDFLGRPLAALTPRSSKQDVSYAASLFLARKVIPTPDGDDPIPSYLSKMGREQTINSGFLRFASQELPKMFPRGWDSKYVGLCGSTIPSGGSSVENPRKRGGSRVEISRSMSREEFVTACMTGSLYPLREEHSQHKVEIPAERLIRVIDDDGKHRIVTVASAKQWFLGPLHHLLYDTISTRNWLLRGEATPKSFQDFTRVDGEVFVSGDYEAATDNFNRLHSEFILELILRSSNIPEPIQKLALSSLTATLITESGARHQQIAGQLMGNLLSFPLLCITNYLAFKYAVPRDVPLRINGDDIVFRATQKEADNWMRVVADSGLVLSRGKTLVHERYFSLNSCFFMARRPDRKSGVGRKPSMVPVLRAKSIYKPLQHGDHAAAQSRLRKACKGFTGRIKGLVRGHILRFHRKMFSSLGCSLNRALGVRVVHPALEFANLHEQEVYFLRQPVTLDKRPPVKLAEEAKLATEGWLAIPAKWVKDDHERRYLSGLWGEHCNHIAWEHGVGTDLDKMVSVRDEFIKFQGLTRMAKLLKKTRRGVQRMLRSTWRKDSSVKRWLVNCGQVRKVPPRVWIPEIWKKSWSSSLEFRPSRARIEDNPWPSGFLCLGVFPQGMQHSWF